jgi:hypothetical protein
MKAWTWFIGLAAASCFVAACSVQDAVDDAGYVCKDGVEFFVYSKYTGGGYSYSLAPHYKNTKGELYACDASTGYREAVSGPRLDPVVVPPAQ